MSDRRHLQPNNATAYERAISEAMDRTPELSPAIVALRGFKFDPPPAIVPYLVAEYGLSEIEDYFSDLRDILVNGIGWQRLRGTPAAMHRALAWVGCDGEIEENPVTRFKWWWFQVHMPVELRSSAFARPMTAVARASKPLRSEFARVTAGYDKRGFNLNGHRLNGGALLNSWSGVRKDPSGPVLSLRFHHRALMAETMLFAEAALGLQHLARDMRVDGSPPTMQRSSMGAGGATAGASVEDHVPFNNAPFGLTAFGEPDVVVQVSMTATPVASN